MSVSELMPVAPGAGGVPVEAGNSPISWKAVFAGSVGAIAVTVVLLTLGAGLGFASVSPWTNVGMSAPAVGALAAVWFIVVQWLSAGLGGYVTGRLRTRWANTHTHEVFFRDTAHGFVTWATATIGVTIVIASVAMGAAGSTAKVAAQGGSGLAQGAGHAAMQNGAAGAYDVDRLFRSSQPSVSGSGTDGRAEAGHILAKGLADGDIPAEDRSYLAALVASRTGLSQEDAQKRVDDTIAQAQAAETKARAAADAARKAAARASILAALAMVIGAFIACAAAALGGHERDLHP
jgi:hypothetical protein